MQGDGSLSPFLSCAEQAQTGQHTQIILGTLGDAKETVTQEVTY